MATCPFDRLDETGNELTLLSRELFAGSTSMLSRPVFVFSKGRFLVDLEQRCGSVEEEDSYR
jgi:hypothetical protein